MSPIINRKKLRSYGLELIVVVLGILIAFQVDEFRERLVQRRDLQASLVRLLEESDENLNRCEFWSELVYRNLVGVRHVYSSLRAGEIIGENHDLFVEGLIYFDVIPNIGMLTSVADEMIATGSLRELDDPALRASVALLPAIDRETRDFLPYWRAGIGDVWAELRPIVDFTYTEQFAPLRRDYSDIDAVEGKATVSYDIDELTANRRLKNMFFDLVDIHSDLLGRLELTCKTVQSTRQQLVRVIGER